MTCLASVCQAAWAADRLDGVLSLVADDNAALSKIHSTPDKHVMLYFDDYQH
jgi:hypothetical protein